MNWPDFCVKLLKVECSIPTLAEWGSWACLYLSPILPPVSSEKEKTWRKTKQNNKTKTKNNSNKNGRIVSSLNKPEEDAEII